MLVFFDTRGFDIFAMSSLVAEGLNKCAFKTNDNLYYMHILHCYYCVCIMHFFNMVLTIAVTIYFLPLQYNHDYTLKHSMLTSMHAFL